MECTLRDSKVKYSKDATSGTEKLRKDLKRGGGNEGAFEETAGGGRGGA